VTIARVLCPTDPSEASAHATEWAVAVAGQYEAAITALHVVSPIFMAAPGMGVPSYAEPIEESEMDRLRKDIAAQFGVASTGRGPLDVVMDVGQPATRILERAASLPADLLVMGTHGTSGFEHLVLGSVTEKVLRKARCPVLTVPPRAGDVPPAVSTRPVCD
jgi:nucleotide-binding universal stress UspA family protein